MCGMVWYGIVEFNVPLGRMCDWHQLITDFGGIFKRNLLITHKNCRRLLQIIFEGWDFGVYPDQHRIRNFINRIFATADKNCKNLEDYLPRQRFAVSG